MAKAMDRSKYRNPDRPPGQEKKDPELVYLEGVEIDGFHYIWAPYLYDAHIEEREDYATLSDLIFSDDDCLLGATGTDGTLSPSKIKKEKDDDRNSDVEKRVRRGKKSHGNSDISTLDASFSEVNIESKKKEKKKKTKKSKKGRKSGYRSDSSSSLSSYRGRSPSPNRRHHSRHGSPSRSRRHSSPSSSTKHRSSPLKDKSGKIVSYSPSPSPPRSDRFFNVKIKEEYDDDISMENEIFDANMKKDYCQTKIKEEVYDVKIKEEFKDQPQHLFGSYYCQVCNITMNSELTYNTHIVGKRHRKNEKLKNVPAFVAQSIPATAISEDQSKYPKPSSGVIRKKLNELAKIQHLLEQTIKTPCPGLNHVIEIQGLAGVQYYCTLCDSACASNSIVAHLVGFKHRMKLVKEFKPGVYEQIQNEPKYIAEGEIKGILRAIQKKEGMGRIKVEREELVDTKPMPESQPSTSRDYESQLSTSRDYRILPSTSRGLSGTHLGMSFPDMYESASIPDISSSDFYCRICQSHMNSKEMWEAHIRGKRHLTNIKKLPGDMPSKTKTIHVPNKRAYLLDRIKYDCPPDEPIVGLNQVRETEIHESNSHSYQCFLCGSCHTSMDILDHLMSLKHRIKYLECIQFPDREIIEGMSDSAAYPLVKDMCAQVEEKEGSGNPEVHVSKNRLFV